MVYFRVWGDASPEIVDDQIADKIECEYQDHRRKVDATKWRNDTPNWPERWLGNTVEKAQHSINKLVLRIQYVEGG